MMENTTLGRSLGHRGHPQAFSPSHRTAASLRAPQASRRSPQASLRAPQASLRARKPLARFFSKCLRCVRCFVGGSFDPGSPCVIAVRRKFCKILSKNFPYDRAKNARFGVFEGTEFCLGRIKKQYLLEVGAKGVMPSSSQGTKLPI